MKDGGPAFPVPWPLTDLDGDDRAVPGMSLRDWFAGMAMQGFLTGTQQEWDYKAGEWRTPKSKRAAEFRAQASYEQADAMLKEREK